MDKGEQVTVYTRWQDVFHDLPIAVKSLDERHGEIRHVAFSHRIDVPDRSIGQFVMRCRQAGITEPVDLTLRWRVNNPAFLDYIRRLAEGRKIFIYQSLKPLKDIEILRVNREPFKNFIKRHKDYFRIRLGHPPYVDDGIDMECDLNLYGRGFILDTFDVCTIGDMFFGEPCFLQTIAEALDKPSVCMMSRRATNSDSWAKNLTPEWQYHKKHLGTVIYDE